MELGLTIALIFFGFLTALFVTTSIIEGREGKRSDRLHVAGHEEAA